MLLKFVEKIFSPLFFNGAFMAFRVGLQEREKRTMNAINASPDLFI